MVINKSIHCEECYEELIGYIYEYDNRLFCSTDCIYEDVKRDIVEKYVIKE